MSTLIFFFQLKRNVENCGQFSTVPPPHKKKIMPRSHYTEIHIHIYIERDISIHNSVDWGKAPNTNTATFHSSLKLWVLRGPGNVFLLMVGSFSPIVSGIMRGDRGNMRQYSLLFKLLPRFFSRQRILSLSAFLPFWGWDFSEAVGEI
jgi:hypothetical protein